MSLVVWHGTTSRWKYLRAGSWVSTSVNEAALYAFLRSRDIGRDCVPMMTRIIVNDDEFSQRQDHHSFVNGCLTVRKYPTDWFSLHDIRRRLSPEMQRLISSNVTILDITNTVKGIPA